MCAKDSFDFKGVQYLGDWNIKNNKVEKTATTGFCSVFNKDFRQWSKVYNKGVDYKIYSDLKTLSKNYEFIY